MCPFHIVIWLHFTVTKLHWDSVLTLLIKLLKSGQQSAVLHASVMPFLIKFLVFQPPMRFNMGKLTLKSETFDIRHPKLQSHPSLRVISLTRKSHIFLYHHGN